MFESNPVIRRLSTNEAVTTPLTLNGVVHRTGTLLLITSVTFALTWRGLDGGQFPVEAGWIGSLAGLALGLGIIFTRSTNPILIGAYALTQGLALGVISYFANQRYPGIALQAVVGTMGSFAVVLWLYSMRVLRATPMFVKVITAALIGIAALYLVNLVAGLFGHPLEIVRGNSNFSIGLSAVIVLIAAVSFVIDFDAIEESVNEGVDARYGWYLAFGLLVGLVWLYLEILRLLSKLRSRD